MLVMMNANIKSIFFVAITSSPVFDRGKNLMAKISHTDSKKKVPTNHINNRPHSDGRLIRQNKREPIQRNPVKKGS